MHNFCRCRRTRVSADVIRSKATELSDDSFFGVIERLNTRTAAALGGPCDRSDVYASRKYQYILQLYGPCYCSVVARVCNQL
jgi:hypothetical protein